MSLFNQGGHPNQSQTLKSEDSREKDSLDISKERQQTRHLTSILTGGKNQFMMNQGSFRDQEDSLEAETMNGIDLPENAEINVERMTQNGTQALKSG
jgi:hypothetical protein